MVVATGGPLELVTRAGVPVLQWPIFDGGALDAVVTTRHGGVSRGPYSSLNLAFHVGDDPDAVLENRRRAASTIGLRLDDLVFCEQTHGRTVAVVDEGDRGRGAHAPNDAIAATDALVTVAAGVGLVVMVADCVPLVLHDARHGVLACVHAGWRGTTARVAEAAVATMCGLGAEPRDVRGGIGPAVTADRYQVGDEVADAARDAFGTDAPAVLRPDGAGRWRLDLWEANRRTLLDAGLAPDHVAVAAIGTGDDRLFSDRRARPCGRFAAIAALTRERAH